MGGGESKIVYKRQTEPILNINLPYNYDIGRIDKNKSPIMREEFKNKNKNNIIYLYTIISIFVLFFLFYLVKKK